MKITKAVITAAGANQRRLPHQLLVDRNGVEKPVINIIADEAISAGVEDIGIVVHPADEDLYRAAAADSGRWTIIAQHEPRGYGHAIYCARDFVGDAPFLHMVGDHVFVSRDGKSSASALIALAEQENCAVSGVQPTRENEIGYFGAVSGQRVRGSHTVYSIDRVVEKPTPTQAEQILAIPGLRTGHYLCFFGMHVLTPALFRLLAPIVESSSKNVDLSSSLNELAKGEKYLAIEANGMRFPVDVKYGLLKAQLALGLSGGDRNEVLTLVCELLAQRELAAAEQEN
ncbi:MAG TPA: sugar phosphate nucleotidyltransferase [Capsulimonadaceae bacterium]